MELYAIVHSLTNEIFVGKDGDVIHSEFKHLRSLKSKDLKLLSINEGRAKSKLAQLTHTCDFYLNINIPEETKAKIRRYEK